jgi:hypothetical protein
MLNEHTTNLKQDKMLRTCIYREYHARVGDGTEVALFDKVLEFNYGRAPLKAM